MNQLRLLAVEAHSLCGSIEYCHREEGCASSAYELSEKLATFRLTIPRAIGAKEAAITVFNDSLTECVAYIKGEWTDTALAQDIYEFVLPTDFLPIGLYFFRPELVLYGRTLYGHGTYSDIHFDNNSTLSDLCQLTLCDFSHSEPKEMYGGIIYHIFVDRFMRGGDVIVPDYSVKVEGEWNRIPEYPEYSGAPLKNNTIYGGTLYGIADKLDYIASLGVNAIYLSPIFESVSNHKYDTANYMCIDSAFGGDEALKQLIEKCNSYGIKLILDGVFNHTGADSIYFNRYGRYEGLGAYQSKSSPYYSWFDFKSHPDKYTCWWDIDILPRINPDLSECREYFAGDTGVIRRYSDLGIYGFRLDVADELSDDFISSVKSQLSKNGESVLYGEVWEDASNKIAYDKRKSYYRGRELDGVMNYPVREGIIDYITKRDTDALRYALCEVTVNAPDRVMHTQMNLLGTHDTERILTVLGAVPHDGLTNRELRDKRMSPEEYAIAVKRLKAAYTVLATLPGIPTIFYGDEAGLEGYHDPFNRMPYPWGRENVELLDHYKHLGTIRRRNSVYKRGAFRLISLSPDLLVFERRSGASSYVTVLNNSDDTVFLSFDAESVTTVLGASRAQGIKLEPMSASIYRLKNAKEIEIVQRQNL